jgi:N-acyl-D-amino-acid deacylase
MFDLIVSGGTVIDGLGGEPFHADLGIRDGIIAAIGDLKNGEAGDRFDASGKILIPGIIDIHTHYDLCLGWQGLAAHCAKQGVTTVIGGNCGIGPGDIRAHLDAAEAWDPGLRYGILVSHGPLRSMVIPREQGRPATPRESKQVRRAVSEALEAGALGLSWGPYHENSLADEAELVEAATAAAELSKPFVVHRRCEGNDGLTATQEAFRIAERTGVALHISHLKIAGRHNWKEFDQLMALMARGQARFDLGFDVYPYEGSLTYLSAMVPNSFKADGHLLRRLADSTQREHIKTAIRQWFINRQGPDDILIFARHLPSLAHKRARSLSECARILGVPCESEAAAQIIESDPRGTGSWAAYRSMMNGDQVTELCSRSDAIIASDSVPEVDGMAETTHPRAYGTFARVLGRAARTSLAELARIVPKMTSLAADRYRLGDLGRLKENCPADLVALDPTTLKDCACYEEPSLYPEGIEAVLIGGQMAYKDGVHRDVQGEVLRR